MNNQQWMSEWSPTEAPTDPLVQALAAVDGAEKEIIAIGLVPLRMQERAALDRAMNHLRNALARLSDVERLSRPPVEHRHPGDGTPINAPEGSAG